MQSIMEKLPKLPDKKKLVAGAAVVVLAAAGWQLYSSIMHKPQEANYIPIVRTMTIGESIADSSTVYPGEVRGRYESQLAFQTAGRIASRLVNVGDRVHAGQILMTIDPKDVNQSVEAANAQLASAIANQKLAADNAARFNKLYAGGAVSEATRDQYNTQLEAANAALRQAQANANASGNQLSYTQLTSDADGVVAADTGESLAHGGGFCYLRSLCPCKGISGTEAAREADGDLSRVYVRGNLRRCEILRIVGCGARAAFLSADTGAVWADGGDKAKTELRTPCGKTWPPGADIL